MLLWLLRQGVGRLIALPIRRHLAAFEAATHRPREVQEQLLWQILNYQAGTDFGREHHFSEIHTLKDFRTHVSVAGYEAFEPYIARVRRGEFQALLADRCVHMFALTSG